MSSKVVYCIGTDESQSAQLLNQLRLAGFTTDDVSALVPDKTGTRDFGYERHTKAPEGAVWGASAGMVGGAVVGWGLASAGADAAILSHLVAGGAAVAALACAAAAGVVGGLLGALAGLAKPEFEARRYNGKLRQGSILVSIHCESPREARLAKDICRQSGSVAIATGREAQIRI